ncbi:EH signature domain-containing protein [Corallococcus coralloides]|uniref:EH signature domain-containing protein n=1 Tax=Corallococcus coralloides TaxID=184914 RepID=UPI00384F6349
MGLDDWLDEVGARQKVVLAAFGTFQQQVEEGMHQLVLRAESVQQRADELEPGRLARLRQVLDVGAVLAKVTAQDFDRLSRRERRAVPGLWREVGLEHMTWFLTRSPDSVPRLVRQRLRDWSASEDAATQRKWAQLVGRRVEDKRVLRWALPMSVEAALGAEGPSTLARHWGDHALAEVVGMLRNSGIKETSPYAGHVIAEYLEGRLQTRQDLSQAMAFLVDDPLGRSWMPHRNVDGVAVSAPMEARIAVISKVLECRLAGRMAPAVLTRLEERLIARDGVFDDPRHMTLTQAWQSVRARAPDAFDAFLSALIQQDLEFFFERAMNEQDRRRFWLNYLGSIRRTTCWLASETYDALRARLANLPAEQQAAFRRARRLPRGKISAFVLSFERYVAVEFSDKGNATYVYEHRRLAQMLNGQPVEHHNDLKDTQETHCEKRLTHLPGWELRFEQELLELGIAQARPVVRRAR